MDISYEIEIKGVMVTAGASRIALTCFGTQKLSAGPHRFLPCRAVFTQLVHGDPKYWNSSGCPEIDTVPFSPPRAREVRGSAGPRTGRITRHPYNDPTPDAARIQGADGFLLWSAAVSKRSTNGSSRVARSVNDIGFRAV